MPAFRRVVPQLALPLLVACTTQTVVTEPAPRVVVAEGRSTPALGIPPGHMPRPGECRIWIHGLPPGRQPRPKSRSCAGIDAVAPAGSWILYRPASGARLVHVREVDDRRAGVIVRIRVFEIASGRFVREERP